MVKTVDVSGFGRGASYELCCQMMLHDALEHFKDRSYEELHDKLVEEERRRKEHVDYWAKRDFKPQEEYSKGYPHGELYLEFWELWKHYDLTGAMAGAVQWHLLYIKQHGYESWINKFAEKEPDRIYEIDLKQSRRELVEHMTWARANPEEASRQAFEEGKRAARKV